MTTCCAYRAPNGEVWIGADSLWSGTRYAIPVKGYKIVRAGKWSLAFASDALIPYTVRRRADQVEALQRPGGVADWLVALYRELQVKPYEDVGSAPYYSIECLLASARGVWDIGSDGLVAEPENGYVAIGSGQHHAHGAAFAMIDEAERSHLLVTPRYIVVRSIEIACLFDLSSAPPVVVERVE